MNTTKTPATARRIYIRQLVDFALIAVLGTIAFGFFRAMHTSYAGATLVADVILNIALGLFALVTVVGFAGFIRTVLSFHFSTDPARPEGWGAKRTNS